MKIKITSPCMAMLIYEAVKSGGQTEGCLCGEVAQEVTKNITDSDVTTTVEDVLSVHSIGSLSLNGANAEINSKPGLNVFGWFRFCRRPLLCLTVREKSIHRKLAKNLVEQNGAPGHVVTILMQERWSENHSTYLWKFAAFLQKDRWFVPCRVEIVNLKASCCGSYKPYPSIHQQQRLPQVTNALTSLNSSFSASCDNTSFDMVQTVRNTGQEIVKSLNDTITKLCTTETKLESAYEEQESLKRTLEELQVLLEKKSRNDEDGGSRNDSDTSDSSDSAEYYGDDKAAELLRDLKSRSSTSYQFQSDDKTGNQSNISDATDIPSKSDSGVISNSEGLEVDRSKNGTPPPAYDPFDTLVDIAKAGLQKGDMENLNDLKDENTLLTNYGDERPWADRTRAGRTKNLPKTSY